MPRVRIDGAVSRGHASESKSHGFESHSCHLMWAYGRRYVQVRPVRPKINHLKKYISQTFGLLVVAQIVLWEITMKFSLIVVKVGSPSLQEWWKRSGIYVTNLPTQKGYSYKW